MTPAEIAARLTPAQKRALLWLPIDGSVSSTRCHWSHTGSMVWLAGRCAAEKHIVGENGPGNDCRWRLTPLGQAVRAIVEQESAPHA